MITMSLPSVHQLKRAVDVAEKIQTLQHELDSLLGQNSSSPVTRATRGRPAAPAPKHKRSSRGGRRNMSPEARERIAEAQRRRWAKYNKDKNS